MIFPSTTPVSNQRRGDALGVSLEAERIEVYSERLADLSPSVLLAVFDRAENECRFFPTMPELREMVGMLSSQVDAMSADRAWVWVTDYLRKHGIDGHDYIVAEEITGECPKCQGTRWTRNEIKVERNGKTIVTREAVRCDCCHVVLREHAPQIPPRLQRTLRAMAPSIEQALEAIRDCEGKWAAKLRNGFNEAYRRAAAQEVAKADKSSRL
jgi:hypothetical protein